LSLSHPRSLGRNHRKARAYASSGRGRAKLCNWAPVLLPLLILVGTGLWGIDFGEHWDESYQLYPAGQTVLSGRLLPGIYTYPSLGYWLALAGIAPEFVQERIRASGAAEVRQSLYEFTQSQAYRLRVRRIYLLVASLAVVWVYLLVLIWRKSVAEALLASCVLGMSWEVAYHSRYIAVDGLVVQFAALAMLLMVCSVLRTGRTRWLWGGAIAAGLATGSK